MRFLPIAPCIATLLLLSSGCVSLSGNSRPRPAQPAPAPQATPPSLRTELLMLNIAEASGWVAFTDSDEPDPETEDYRIIIQRESTGERLFDSRIPLAKGLRTHGFEMSREDARLLNIAATVDAGILPPLSQFPAETTPAAPTEERPTAAPTPPSETNDAIDVLTGVQILNATDTALTLSLDDPGTLALGDRLFLRTPPETLQDPATGSLIVLSRGRIAGLLEITALEDNTATATLQSGEIPEAGYLERVKNDESP